MTVLGLLFPSLLRDDCQNLFLFHIVRAARAGLRIAPSNARLCGAALLDSRTRIDFSTRVLQPSTVE
jgi:hypothetical protein